MATKTKAKPGTTPDAGGKAKPAPLPPVPANVVSLLSPADVCAALRIRPRKLRQAIAAGEYPRPDLDFAGPRWLVTTHETWVASKRSVEP